MKKKLSAFLALITLMCTIIPQSVLGAAFSDVDASNPFHDAIISLSSMGIIKGYDEGGQSLFKPDNNITRAEFAVLVSRLLNVEDISYSSYDFTDITAHYARNQIQTIYKRGIINGYGDGNFGPDDNITYEQAIKMMVGTLGYGFDAETFGGYPNGYIQMAQTLGITSDITAVYTEPASRGVVSQLMYNCLEVGLQRDNGDGTRTITEDTIMEDYLGIYRVTGIVVGVGESVTENSTQKLAQYEMGILSDSYDDELVINYTTYTQNISDMTPYLGKTVTAYFRSYENLGEMQLINIEEETVKNSVTQLSHKDIISYDNRSLRYYDEDERSRVLSLSGDDMSVIYNGKIVKRDSTVTLTSGTYTLDEALSRWLDPNSEDFITGDVTATDAGSNGDINLLTIMDYDLMVARTAPTSSDYRINDMLVTGNYLILDPDSTDYSYSITKNGSAINVNQISANDVVQYARSLDGELYTVVVTSNRVSGTITSLNDADSKVSVENVEYDMTDTFRSYLESKSYDLRVGATGTFYTDKDDSLIFGTVAAAETIPYGIIISSSTDETDDSQGFVTFYSPTNNSSKARMQLDDSVRLNGRKEAPATVVSRLQLASQSDLQNQDVDNAASIWNGEVTLSNASQVARIGVSGGKVTSVITAEEEYGTNTDESKLVKYQPLKQLQYSSTNRSFGDFYIDSQTTILFMPQNRSDKDEYKRFSFTNGVRYWVEAYNVSESKTASLVVVYGSTARNVSTNYNTKYSIVARTPEEIVGSDDEITHQLTLYNSAQTETKIEAEDDSKFADILVGDVIQYALDDGKAAVRKNIFDIEDISAILDGQLTDKTVTVTDENGEESESTVSYKYDWTDSKFSFKYNNNNSSGVPYSRAIMANVLRIEEAETGDGMYMHIVQNGFDPEGNVDSSNEERFLVSLDPAELPIVRVDRAAGEVTPYVDGTETYLSVNDIRDIVSFGEECSKVMLYIAQGRIEFIAIYE